MVQKVETEQQAKHTARMLVMFRRRLQLVDVERACLTGMINELQDVLLAYRAEAEETERNQEES